MPSNRHPLDTCSCNQKKYCQYSHNPCEFVINRVRRCQVNDNSSHDPGKRLKDCRDYRSEAILVLKRTDPLSKSFSFFVNASNLILQKVSFCLK